MNRSMKDAMKAAKMKAITSMLVAILIFLAMGMWGIGRVYALRSDRTDQPVREGRLFSITDPQEKIEGFLLERFASQQASDFIVAFVAQADLAPAYKMSWITRGEYVYESLGRIATQSQAGAKILLDAAGLHYQTFLAGNELYAVVQAGVRDDQRRRIQHHVIIKQDVDVNDPRPMFFCFHPT